MFPLVRDFDEGWLAPRARAALVVAVLCSTGCAPDTRPAAPDVRVRGDTDGGVSTVSGAQPAQAVAAYADLDDIRVYYERQGSGEPLVMLHGGFGSSEIWAPYFSLLPQFTLIAPDSRGQGRTTLGDGPITYERMAADVIRLLDHLGIGQAHIVGFSDGGCTALHLLVDHSQRVKSATLIGTPYHTNNYPAPVYAFLQSFIAKLADPGPQEPALQARRDAYATIAPRPQDWRELVHRLGQTWLTQPQFTDRQLGLIARPVLVVKVDHDEYLPAAVFDATAALIPGARMLHVPQGTHAVARQSPEQIADGIRSFLASLADESAVAGGGRDDAANAADASGP